jgi:hypothetical protein
MRKTILLCALLSAGVVAAQEIKVAMPDPKPAVDATALANACNAAMEKRFRECMRALPPFTGYNGTQRRVIADSCESEKRGIAAQCQANVDAAAKANAQQ